MPAGHHGLDHVHVEVEGGVDERGAAVRVSDGGVGAAGEEEADHRDVVGEAGEEEGE